MRAPEIQEATLVLKELPADEKLRQQILDRELNQAAYRIEMGAAHAEGEAHGLRTAIESMAELLGIEIGSEQRRSLDSMSIEKLKELVAGIRHERTWPEV